MLGTFLEWVVNLRANALKRSWRRGDDDEQVVADILRCWKLGAGAGLRGWEAARLVALEAQVPWWRRMFFWEGQAVGISGRAACLHRAGHLSDRYHAPGFRFMFWTGVGFWNGVSSPFPKISLAPERWAHIPEFEEEYSLILGGTGFSSTVLAGGIDAGRLEATPGVRGPQDLAGAYRGAGRALWFLYMHNPSALAAVLDAHPERADFMAQGLGIAITYTQLSTPDRIFRDLAALPQRYWPPLLSGTRVALAGLAMDDPRIDGELNRLPAPLDALLAEARSGLVTVPSGPGWAQLFVENGERYTSRWSGLCAPTGVS